MPLNPVLAFRAAALFAAVSAASPATAHLAATQDLSFGAFAAGAGGTVTISPQGSRTTTGDVTLLTGGQASQGSSASFEVSGSTSASYRITLPADGTVALTGSNGGSMPVSSFTSSPSGTGQLNMLGAQTLNVGATLRVGSAQPPGGYSGSFNVTVIFE